MCPEKRTGSPRQSDVSDVKATASKSRSGSRSLVITRVLEDPRQLSTASPYVIDVRVEEV